MKGAVSMEQVTVKSLIDTVEKSIRNRYRCRVGHHMGDIAVVFYLGFSEYNILLAMTLSLDNLDNIAFECNSGLRDNASNELCLKTFDRIDKLILNKFLKGE